MRRWPLVVLICCAWALPGRAGRAAAQSAGPAPGAPGRDPGASVDSIFGAFGPRGPGCAVQAVRDGSTVLQRSYGLASLELGVPITPRTAFYAASLSKQFTAFAVALLVDEGKLSPGDDIRKWIPEVPDFGEPITVDELVHHTSGLRDYFELLRLTGWPLDGPLTESQFLELVARQKALNFRPGTRFLYSNTGYVLLSVLIRRLTGESLREFAAARIFRPLGMTSTGFRADHASVVPNRAEGYGPRAGGGWGLSLPGFDVVGDGGLYTTVEDLARWDANAYDQRVGEGDVARLVSRRGRLATGEEIPYGWGITLGEYRGARTIEHGGAYGGYRTELLRFPELHFTVLTLCNAATAAPAALSRRVADLLMGERLGPLPAERAAPPRALALPRDELARRAGPYWSAEWESYRRFALRDGILSVTAGGDWVSVHPVAGDRFYAGAGAPAYTFYPAESPGPADSGGAPARGTARAALEPASPGRVVEVDAAGDSLVLDAVPDWRPAPAELRAFAGIYRSEELDVGFRLSAGDRGLSLLRPGLPATRLEPAFRDAFAFPGGLLRFQRAGDGAVTGFTLSAGRVKGLRFDAQR